jgi:AAA domain
MLELEQLVSSGRCNRPTGQFWYGPEATRKTGSVVSPTTLFLDLERGSDQYDVDRVHISAYRDLTEALDLIIREKSKYEIIVVDPIEIAEKLLIGETCRQLRIDGLQGLPHGAAWQYLRENFDTQLMTRFGEIRRTGRHMVIIGHAQVRTVTLPGLAEPFDRYEPRLDKRNADTLIEWADHVLFFDWDLRTAKNREGIVRALSGNEPVVRVVHGPGWTAKNRIGLLEPLKAEFAALTPLFGTLTTPDAPPVDRPGAAGPEAGAPTGASASATSSATTDSGTKQEPPPNPDKASTDPFFSDEERRAVETFLANLPKDKLLAFLRKRSMIREDEDFHSLGPHYLRRILADRVGFEEAVERD